VVSQEFTLLDSESDIEEPDPLVELDGQGTFVLLTLREWPYRITLASELVRSV
jgi:hypothetical protein